MAGSSNSSEEKTCRRFLEQFLGEFRGPFAGEEDPLPLRPVFERIAEDEAEGECLDVCLQQLYKYNCPSFLASALARATADEVLQSDLSEHYLPNRGDGTDGILQIDTVKLARTVFSKLHEICHSWVKDFPLRRKRHLYYETSIHAIKNMRRKMEDKHVCIPDFNLLFNIEEQEEQAYFAVFDGHGGVDAAIYAALHLHVNFVRQETFSVDPSEALCAAFRVTDERFVQKAARENIRCGTTGVVTFIKGNMLHVAWLGDSQVMLVKKGQAVELMKPHKPDREDEKQRIEALGGCVVWFGAWRVNGSLSVSRAIGDAEHKPYICGEADSTTVVLDGTEDYLILACDGFYDTVSPEEAVKVVSDHLKENNGDSSMVAHKLVASARDAGSSDNITVIVVFLRDMNTTENVSQDSNWTENSFEGGQDDNGDDKENHGDCKASRPLHQCSAPADLGYDDRENSFTDRTSLNLGPKMNLIDDQGYLDLMQGGASMPRSAKCLPSTQVFSSGIPKKVHLVNKILKAQPSESSLAKGHRRVRESLEISSLWQIYRMNCSPSFYWGVPYEQFETPRKCASLVHLYYPKRRRGTKGKPKLQALLFPQGLIHKAGSRRSRLVWSSTGKRVLRSSIPRKQTTPKGYCEKVAVAPILKESNSIPSTDFHNSCKI